MFQSATWSTSDRQSKVYDPRIHVSMRYSDLNCKRPTLNRVVGQDQHPPQGSHSFRISRIVSHITGPGTDAVIPHRFSSPENPGFGTDSLNLSSSCVSAIATRPLPSRTKHYTLLVPVASGFGGVSAFRVYVNLIGLLCLRYVPWPEA